MLKKIIFGIWTFILCNIFWGNHGIAQETPTDIQILTTSESHLSIIFEPREIITDTLYINSLQYHRVHFKEASYPGLPGDPLIPCRVIVVGVPDNGDAEVTITGSEFTVISKIKLLPAPFLEKKEDIAEESYREGPGYHERKFSPAVLFETDEPGYFGKQKIIRIRLYPIQYNPVENTIRLYSRINLQVSFNHDSPTVNHSAAFKNEDVYKNTLINYAQSRQWRKTTSKSKQTGKSMNLTGEQYKIPVSREGIFKVTGSFLSNNGINIGSIEPSTLKIYNNGGRELPRNITASRPDSLIENPIALFGMEDGQFDGSDYILFYGKGITGWELDNGTQQYRHYINHYCDENIYWLVFNDGKPGKRIQTIPTQPSADQSVNTTWDHYFLEQEINNPLRAGLQWYGQYFSNGYIKTYTVNLTNPSPGDTLQFRFRVKGATSGSHQFTVKWNGSIIKTILYSGSYPLDQDVLITGQTPTGQDILTFEYFGSTAYLDWFEVDYKRKLQSDSGRLGIYSPDTPGVYQYTMSDFGTLPTVFCVPDPASVYRLETQAVSQNYTFTDSVSSFGPKRYFASQESGYLIPQAITQDNASNLRNPANSCDLVIITHSDFVDQALQLKDHRETVDSLTVTIADIQDVFDEFSGGLYDPVAIRDFLKYTYDNWTITPVYCLLFGDGDFDYQNTLSDDDKNWIPPFEFDGITESSTRPSDDWYTYISGNDSYMDLAIGRFPVQTKSQAQTVVDKIIQYETQPVWGDWRHMVTMVGDDEKTQRGDENETIHTKGAESIAENNIPDLFNFNKIYLTEYPDVLTIDGRRKPQANDDLIEQINLGTILVNFIGHGNQYVWAHEHVFQRDKDLPRLHNNELYPLFYAATCSFGLFDEPSEQSFAEELVIRSGKGGIGVIAAARLCSASPNESLNRTFMDRLFQEFGPTLRLGDALRSAKLSVYSTTNNEVYHIFGDPTLRLSVPRFQAVFTHMEPDSFKALSIMTVEGDIQKDSDPWTNFNGTIALKAYDAKKNVVYTTQYGTNLPYILPGNSLFRGNNAGTDGTFQIQFRIPKDITYGGHTGRLSCYFWDENQDGCGYLDNIEVGGSTSLNDTEGPDIILYFSGQDDFITGGMVSEKPELIASIQDDSSGINITGEIGHKIMLTLDGSEQEDITSYFEYDEGSFLKGELLYPLTAIAEGEHNIFLKAWDNANNSTTQSLMFQVISEEELRLENVLNYPNPFDYTTGTHFTFQLNLDAEIEIKIFTVSGRLIKQLDGIWGEPGFNMVPEEGWDGRDDMGDELANGVYLYKVIAKAHTGEKELRKEVIGRAMIMR
ncbi:type IX secretion system sortase PorU [bacterium]